MYRRRSLPLLLLLTALCLCCLLPDYSTVECATTAKPAKGASSSTAKPTNNVKSTTAISKTKGKANATTKVGPTITLRVGENGGPEQCQCVTFHLCDSENVVSQSSTGESITCPEQLQVCCSTIIDLGSGGTSETDPPPQVSLPGSSTDGTVISQSPTDCVCVPFHQCINYQQSTSGEGLIDPRFGCPSAEICCPTENVSPTPPYEPPITPSSPEPPVTGGDPICGVRGAANIDTRIVSPETLMQTSFGEFPWMALILTSETAPNGTRIDNVFVCGASIISSNAVLTAAHCISDVDINTLKIRVGEYDTHKSAQNEPLPHQDRAVTAVHIHPFFNSKTLFNDTAILVAAEPFQYAQNVAPICLPLVNSEFSGSTVYDPNNCLATGWGKNAFDEGVYQTKLRKVDLSLVSHEVCQTRLRNTRLGQFFKLDTSFICAGGQAGMDTCQGDGGGPLICQIRGTPNRYIQVGVVSWGIGCGSDVPAVYASLEANANWLTAEINTLFVFRRAVK